MDNLSSLSSDLPGQASAAQELAQLDSSIISEFKAAACAVTKLYKLSGAKQAIVRRQGYLDAIQDLLDFMTSDNRHGGGGERNADEVLAWALQKQEDLNTNSADNNSNNNNNGSRTAPTPAATSAASTNYTYSTPSPASAEAARANTVKKAAAERKEAGFHPPDNVATLNMQHSLPTSIQSFSGNLFNFDPLLAVTSSGIHHHHHHNNNNNNNNNVNMNSGSNSMDPTNTSITATIASANNASSESDQEDDFDDDFVSGGSEDMKKRIKYSGSSNLDFKRHRF
ncbi:hypothetical protein DV453_002460 [Geotrichum candidum]|nr:hypothetical protein DV453_002460 [Geotrichum candidum]